MSKQTKPVKITSPRRVPSDLNDLSGSAAGTPSRSFRSPGTPSTPPIANIPPRVPSGAGVMSYGSPSGLALGLGLPSSRASPSAPLRPRTPAQAGDGRSSEVNTGSASGSATPRNLEEVSEEEMARVLRRHLVSRSERNLGESSTPEASADPAGGEALGEGTRKASFSGRSSGAASRQAIREDSEPFPIPYDAPGGDIT